MLLSNRKADRACGVGERRPMMGDFGAADRSGVGIVDSCARRRCTGKGSDSGASGSDKRPRPFLPFFPAVCARRKMGEMSW